MIKKKALPQSRVWLEIKLSALKNNFRRITQKVKPCSVLAVLKANGYGLGAMTIAKALDEAGARRFGIAEIKEAIPLVKNFSQDIQVMSALLPSEIEPSVRLGLICPVGDLNTAQHISREARRQKKNVRIHIKVDTGMGRLGIPYFEAETVIKKIAQLPRLNLEGLYSHFSNANNPKNPHSLLQKIRFEEVLHSLKANGLQFPFVHMANSDAINNLTETIKSPYNMVRTGINLYGVYDLEGRRSFHLEPTLSLKTRLIARRRLPAGFTIGYGCSHTLFKDTWVGTIPAGYADGIPLAASNSSEVLVKGRACPVLGRVSMDYLTLDLNKCPEAKVGDEVIIVGKSGKKELTIEDWARIKQTHPYDIICSLGPRVERIPV